MGSPGAGDLLRAQLCCDRMAAAELDPARALADLRALRELTEDDRGAQRVAWTGTWARAREWLLERLAELPLDVDRDEAGNLWAVLRGARAETVVLGSHIDSVPDGGWLDGALGVLAGLEVVRAIAARGEPPVTVALVDWADEEGARFGRSLLGSGLATGMAEPHAVAGVSDRDGTRLVDALAAHGVDLEAAPGARARLEPAVAYLELHIEQGPVLEREGLSVGVVTGTAGVERHAVRIRGQAVQGGGFPMDARRDALVAAARLVLAVRDAARDDRSRATVGTIAVRPAIPTAVPGECELVVDQRHPDARELAAMLSAVHDAAARIAVAEDVEIDFERVWAIEPVAFDAALVELADEAAREVTGASARLFSGARHDAAAVARAGVPAAMLFVQSTGGISHAREEDTAPEHLEAAIRTLARLTDRVIQRATPRA
jgi:hydantoinase/carbamoylase family amidase